MRKHPAGFLLANSIQWACAVVDRHFGMNSLQHLPMLLAGYGAVLDSPFVTPEAAKALMGLRLLGADFHSKRSIHRAIAAHEEYRHRSRTNPNFRDGPYRFVGDGLTFRRIMVRDDRIDAMIEALEAGLPLKSLRRAFADISQPMEAMSAKGSNCRRIGFNLSGIPVPPPLPPMHDLSPVSRDSIEIPVSDLEEISKEFDAQLVARGREPVWHRRLRRETGETTIDILRPGSAGLETSPTITVDGLRHLIGLPGSGKSTIVALVAAWMDRRGKRVVILVPSIEEAMKKIAEYRDLGMSVSLLSGQSKDTRLAHARRFARKAAAGEGRGLGISPTEGSDLLALGCALEGFDDDQKDDRTFPRFDPPCSRIEQGGHQGLVCPLSGQCGRLTAQRELVTANIWIGHVLSLDTRIPAPFSEHEVTFLEFVARTADLVVVDEADGAQHVLDVRSITTIDVTGTPDSIDSELVKRLMLPSASGDAQGTGPTADFLERALLFRKLSMRIVTHLQHARSSRERFLDEFEKGFLTGNRVAAALFGAVDAAAVDAKQRTASERRFSAISEFVETAVSRGVFGHEGDIGDDPVHDDVDFTQMARALGIRGSAKIRKAWIKMADEVSEWIKAITVTRQQARLKAAQDAVFAIIPPQNEGEDNSAANTHLFRFLVEVTAVVLQFLSVSAAQRSMVGEGLIPGMFYQKGMSDDFLRSVPEAIMGRLSGLSYEFRKSEDATEQLALSYLVFRGAPRIALYRLHEMLRREDGSRGPNVLLTSATSFLEDSPSYHIGVGPHYVLRRRDTAENWKSSIFLFSPLTDPDNPKRKLFFSGASGVAGRRGLERERVLRHMASHFFSGFDPGVDQLNRTFEAGRKTGFVVNSYEQVRLFKEEVARLDPERARRLIAVVKEPPQKNDGDWITAAQVESLGERNDWDALIFPMKSLARGVNIVWAEDGDGRRKGQAALGTIAFLTRPHPSSESKDFVAGIVGKRSLDFDGLDFDPGIGLVGLVEEYGKTRQRALGTVRSVLRERLVAQRLNPELERAFVADLMVDFLQTIGRGIRDGCKVRVLFVDAAWSRGTITNPDGIPTLHDSTLAMMHDILDGLVNGEGGSDKDVYRLLYEPFLYPLSRCGSLRATPDEPDEETMEMNDYAG